MALHSTVPRPAQEGISPFRWFLKKSARLGLIAGAWGSAGLGLSLSGTAPQLRVLTYHRFGTRIRDPFCVAPADFAAQMVWLAENQLAAGIDEVKEFVAGRRSLDHDHDKVLVTI